MAHGVQLVTSLFCSIIYVSKSVFHCLAQTTQWLQVFQRDFSSYFVAFKLCVLSIIGQST